jgi:hypothetical protein
MSFTRLDGGCRSSPASSGMPGHGRQGRCKLISLPFALQAGGAAAFKPGCTARKINHGGGGLAAVLQVLGGPCRQGRTPSETRLGSGAESSGTLWQELGASLTCPGRGRGDFRQRLADAVRQDESPVEVMVPDDESGWPMHPERTGPAGSRLGAPGPAVRGGGALERPGHTGSRLCAPGPAVLGGGALGRLGPSGSFRGAPAPRRPGRRGPRQPRTLRNLLCRSRTCRPGRLSRRAAPKPS